MDAGRAARGVHVGEIGLALMRERRRDADDDRVAIRELLRVGGEGQPLSDQRLEALGGHVLDPGLPALEALHGVLVHVEADDVRCSLGKRDRQRQADVAQADDPYTHRASLCLRDAAARRAPFIFRAESEQR